MAGTADVRAGLRVRRATRADAPALATVHLDTVLVAYAGIFPTHAPVPALDGVVEEWEAAFADRGFSAFLAEDGAAAVGTVAVRADPDAPGCGQLRRLHVLPQLWGRGVGSGLYNTALAAMRTDGYAEAGLWVLEDNARARAFYERRGWTLVPARILTWPGLETIEVRYRLDLPVASTGETDECPEPAQPERPRTVSARSAGPGQAVSASATQWNPRAAADRRRQGTAFRTRRRPGGG